MVLIGGLLVIMVLAAVYTVMTNSIIKSAIGLAVVSIILTIIMFALNSPLAGAFELSVCAGLITVVFVSTISFTHRRLYEEQEIFSTKRKKRFMYLPVILLLATGLLCPVLIHFSPDIPLASPLKEAPVVREVLWFDRSVDIMGQIIIILAGVFGISVLIKEKK